MKMVQAHSRLRIYLAVFTVLMFLTVVTVTVSYLHLAKGPAIALGLLIATIKASLVAAFFMHLRGERLLIYGVLGLAFFFVVFLFLLPIFDITNIAATRIPEHEPTSATGVAQH